MPSTRSGAAVNIVEFRLGDGITTLIASKRSSPLLPCGGGGGRRALSKHRPPRRPYASGHFSQRIFEEFLDHLLFFAARIGIDQCTALFQLHAFMDEVAAPPPSSRGSDPSKPGMHSRYTPSIPQESRPYAKTGAPALQHDPGRENIAALTDAGTEFHKGLDEDGGLDGHGASP